MEKVDIFLEAIEILDSNCKISKGYSYTTPSENNLVQSSWNSLWITYGNCALNKIDRAEKEMLSLLSYQWNNGLLPSVIYNNFELNNWELEKYGNNFTRFYNTDGLISQPLHADVCLKIYEIGIDKVEGKFFLDRVYKNLILWHKYLYKNRDINNEGLIFLIHPDESIMSNSPMWDNIKNKNNLLQLIKECKYNEIEIYKKSNFIIQDVLFNVLLLKSNYALKKIANILGKKDDLNIIKSWITKTKEGIENKLFFEGFYYNINLKDNKRIPIKTISGLSAYYFSSKIEEIVDILKKEFIIKNENNFALTSLSKKENNFDSSDMWKGSMFINLAWLIISILEKNKSCEALELAKKIKSNCLKNIEKLGFYEYYDSVDNYGFGDDCYSLTASMYICFQTNQKF